MSAKRDAWRNRIVDQGERPAGDFLANPKNWRVHPKAQREALTGVLSEVGWVQSVIVNRTTGHVVDGHARIEEALKLGDETPVPFVEVELSEAEEAKILATIDPISAMAGADKAALDSLLHEVETSSAAVGEMLAELAEKNGLEYGATIGGTLDDAEPQIDKAVELAKKWGTARGQVWRLGEHRLMCGDSTSAEDVERLMAGERADAVVADPPYGTGIDAKTGLGNSSIPMVMIGDKDASLAKKLYSIWEKMASIQIWWGANYYSSALPDSTCWLVWDKDHHGMTFADAELAFTNSKSPIRVFRHAWSGNHRDSEREDTRSHPTQKPIALYAWLLETHAVGALVIAEPCSGSGTTIMACEQLGRKCRAMEIAPEYVAVALERWATATGKTPELVTEVTP